jgi:ketol-acid reductoisomerase
VPPEALADCQVIAVLVPDETQVEVLESVVLPYAPAGALLVFAHGFALRHPRGSSIRDDLDVALVGPLGPGSLLWQRFEEGRGLAGLVAVVQDASARCHELALAYGAALRMTRAGLLETTLDEEVVSDLFAEQVVLVGGVVELMRAAWETLVERGISEEVAYYSVVQELKQILDLVHEEGISGMRDRISATARYGGLTRGPRVLGEAARERMRAMLEEIEEGDFAREWADEAAAGGPRLEELRRREADHPMEAAGSRVRKSLRGG